MQSSPFEGTEALNPFTQEPIRAAPKVSSQSRKAVKLFQERSRDDPAGFIREILQAEPLPWQIEFLEKIRAGTRRISIRAGHGVGKSTACSWALLWHMLTRYPQKSVCTAPAAAQLYDALFAELKGWVNKLPDYLKALLEVKTDKITLKGASNESFISARTSSSDKPEALAGIHSENVLIIVDEASGVDEKVFEAAAGSMSGHSAITVLISNPTRNSGTFFRSHHELAGEVWETMHVSCLDDNPLISPAFLRDMERGYGIESNAYRIRVLGEFATSDDDTIISASDVDGAMSPSRLVELDPAAPLLFGVDVAGQGADRQVLCKRQGDVVLEFKVWRNLDPVQLLGAVVAEARRDNPAEICVDSIGMGGPLAAHLRDQGFNVRDVNVAESSALRTDAFKLRDELWLECRDWLARKQCKLPKDDLLRADLVAPRYSYSSSGKYVIESKEKLKRRGFKSPDMADALNCTFASTAAGAGGRSTPWMNNKPIRRRLPNIC